MVGLGIEGIDLVRYLGAQGAQVTVSDARPASALKQSLAAIADVPGVTLTLGGNRERDLDGAEAVFLSQGVPADLPAVRAARERGAEVSSMTRLFMELCPAPIAGITGSSGKTTTTALVGAMLEASGRDYVVAGLIGVGMLGLLDRIAPLTTVVLELSHTQLESIDQSPAIASVTNVTPNHLDRYSWPTYVGLKRRIFEFQRPDDLAIFNVDDEVCAGFADEAPGHVAYTSMARALPGDGVTISGGMIVRRRGGEERPVLPRDEIRLRGEHNMANVIMAIAVAGALEVPDAVAAVAARDFTGVPHRLEPVATLAGVQWVNDSIATTPERTLAGLRSFTEPVVLLLGGRDKHLPTRELAIEAMSRCRAVVTFGEATELFMNALNEVRAGDTPTLAQAATVEEAVGEAARLARPGDVVLFSPAATSFDAYRNFEERGRAFREAVYAMAGGSA